MLRFPCFVAMAFVAFDAIGLPGAPLPVAVEIVEGVADKPSWKAHSLPVTEKYAIPAFGMASVSRKYSPKGHRIDRSNPFLVYLSGSIKLPKGSYRFLLRSRGGARLFINGKVVATTTFRKPNGSGHERVPDRPSDKMKDLYPLPPGHQQKIVTVSLKGGDHRIRVETLVGGKKMRNQLGDLVIGLAGSGERFTLLGDRSVVLDDEGWLRWTHRFLSWQREQDRRKRWEVSRAERGYWKKRHQMAKELIAQKEPIAIPKVSESTPVHNAIDAFIGRSLEKHKTRPVPLLGDLEFLRRVTLDTVGVLPTPEEVSAFLKEAKESRREKAIDRLLADDRWADHQVSYWQDVLAENPGILKPMLNNTGPFRWWLYDAILDNLPMDRFATELILMEGSQIGGGPAGFALATQNDVPMAAKAHVLTRAFLGLEMGCARCHDAPHHPFIQKQTFQLAAMLAKKTLTVPKTSSVKVAELARRPLIQVTLKPGAKVKAEWPFPDLVETTFAPGVIRQKANPREKLAALITSPENERFAQVLVNRMWKRLLGQGLVEPVDDWSEAEPSHPELLAYLGRELITHNYDLKHVTRLILRSHTYQRKVVALKPVLSEFGDEIRLFASPLRRRLSAEQLVDSLFAASGKEMGSEELTLDPEGRRAVKVMMTLGRPQRSWEFTSLSNERDRPALAMPIAQSIVDLLKAYGWRASRPNPVSVRDETPTPLQPLLLANGIAGQRFVRLSDDSAFTELCLEEQSVESLVEKVFVQVLTRMPLPGEKKMFVELLRPGYPDRRPENYPVLRQKKRLLVSPVSWSNHLSPEATRIKLELEKRAREGDPPTRRLRKDWRERMEDMLWSLMNSPEFVFVP